MATVQLHNSFDGPPRPQTHQGVHSSPAPSPRIVRPSSQASLHLAPSNYSVGNEVSSPAMPYTAFPGQGGNGTHAQPYRHYVPSGLSLPSPHQPYMGNFPTSAPPMGGNLPNFWQGPAPLFDMRSASGNGPSSQPMIRTISHAHPMQSATEQTASSRYSSSPNSANHDINLAPPHSATGAAQHPSGSTYSMISMGHDPSDHRHVNPSIFNSQPMSRSTSGASEAAGEINTRLLTPHYDYRESPNTHEVELRKVSDSLGGRVPSGRYYQHTLSPHPEYPNEFAPAPAYTDHNGNLGDGSAIFSAHPQPDMGYLGSNTLRNWGNDFALSAERVETKPDITFAETDYERERAQQIMSNKKLLAEIGLGGGPTHVRTREVSGAATVRRRQASTPMKRRVPSEAPIRASPRIASLHRSTTYVDLDGNPIEDPSDDDDEYDSDQDQDDEEEFRPSKRSKGGYRGGSNPRRNTSHSNKRERKELSLYSFCQTWDQVPHLFPLFYYTLNNDLTINPDSVPLIGSIPSTATPAQKAEMLQTYFHRGRRVLAQLDAFTVRCDRKYEGPEAKWAELDHSTRIAIRDVRRKVVERCENYKYTRRDILDKVVGKNKWQPIEHGLVEWKNGMSNKDPAGDLANVTLTLPTAPPSVYAAQQHQFQRQGDQQPPHHQSLVPQIVYPARQIKSFPSRARLVSGTPMATPRSISITMGESTYEPPSTSHSTSANGNGGESGYSRNRHQLPATAPLLGYGYQNQLSAPMYSYSTQGSDHQASSSVTSTHVNVPMSSLSHGSAAENMTHSSQPSPLPSAMQSSSPAAEANDTFTASTWDEGRGLKRNRSGEDIFVQEDSEDDTADPVWQG